MAYGQMRDRAYAHHGLMSATRRHEDIARKFIGKYAGRPRGGTARAGGRRVMT